MSTGLEGLAYPPFELPPSTYVQGPAEVLDYSIDWTTPPAPGSTDFVLPAGDTIAQSTWTADTGLDIGQFTGTDTSTTVWVSGGVGGYLYRVANVITTAGGRVAERYLWFKIVDR